jgi:hypothetical protein
VQIVPSDQIYCKDRTGLTYTGLPCGIYGADPCAYGGGTWWCICTPCPSNHYCPDDGGRGSVNPCIDKCPDGTYWHDRKPCTSCAQRDCRPCPGGFWCQNEKIMGKCTICKRDQYVKHRCTASSDTVCADCTKQCQSDEYSYTNECRYLQDKLCYTCPKNSVLKPNGKSYTDCLCARGYKGEVLGPNISTCTRCNGTEVCDQVNMSSSCPK